MQKVIPHLASHDVAGSIDFYTKTLGFKATYTQKNAEGTPDFVILEHENVEIMIADAATLEPLLDEYKRISASMIIYILTEDVDALYTKVSKRIAILKPLEETPWGTKEFWIRDNNGYVFSFFMTDSGGY
jgi:uncharacterized glyoxalase superfamily protein PhnB